MKNLKLFLLIAIAVFALSCSKNKNEIDEGYLIELENDYNRSISAETGGDDEEVFTYNEPAVNSQSSTAESIAVTTRAPVSDSSASSRFGDNSSLVVRTTSENVTPAPEPRVVAPATSTTTPTVATAPARPTTFTSQWVDTKDSKVIKDVRLMIANREYEKAQRYIKNLNMNNLPGTDIGHLYQFKGIVNYFLVPTDTEAFSTAIESFQKAFDMTGVDKFKPLSILWLGMLYERYSNNTVELTQAVNLFDEITEKYSNTRFANDAIFYKALALQKLGRIDEANSLVYNLETSKYPDTLVYSKWSNDYVELKTLLPRLKA